MPTKKATEPIEVEIVNIDELRTAIYEAILMANNADDIDKLNILSKLKYQGKGWAALAKAQLESEREQQGGDWEIGKKAISRKAREIQRSVEVRRKFPGLEDYHDD